MLGEISPGGREEASVEGVAEPPDPVTETAEPDPKDELLDECPDVANFLSGRRNS